jgi:hypothetical protein
VADRQRKGDAFESTAAGRDRISQLATSKRTPQHNTRVSAGYLGAAKDLKSPGLTACELRIEAARILVARQRGAIARLERHGCPTTKARHLLSALQEVLALIEKQRDVCSLLER